MSYVSGLIAGSQLSKSDFRSFSKLLPGPFLLQIKLFRGPKLPKQHFKAQKSKIELKMSKNGFGLDASDRENCALRMAPASLQNFWRSQTGRHSVLPFVGGSGAVLGSPPRSAGNWLVLQCPMSASQPSKSDFGGFSKTDRQTDWQTDRLTDWQTDWLTEWLREREWEREREGREGRDSQPLTTTHHQARTLAAALNFVAPGDASHVAEPLLQACALGPETYGRYITAATEV